LRFLLGKYEDRCNPVLTNKSGSKRLKS